MVYLFNFTESKSKLKEGLPPECQMACLCALSKFQEISGQVKSGNITIIQLHKIKSNQEQMKRLCAAATPQDKEADLTYSTVSHALQQRLEEFQTFERSKGHLFNLGSQLQDDIQGNYECCNLTIPCRIITLLVYIGLPELQQELKKDFSCTKINTICVRAQSGEVQLLCFQSAGSLNDFAEHFFIMTQTYVSDLFHQAWTTTMDNAVKTSTLKLADIHTSVWHPAFLHCQTMLEQLHNQSMKLVEVDKFFKHYRGQQLESQLMTLFKGVNACTKLQNESTGTFIERAVHRMNDYWDLCKYQEAANIFLELRSVLNLKGDFKNVERLSTEVSPNMNNLVVNDTIIMYFDLLFIRLHLP